MRLPRVYRDRITASNGFTVTEVIVVIGLAVIIAAFGLGVGIDTYRRQVFDTDLDTVVLLLQKARNLSMNNIGQTPHGVHIDNTDGYILFSGSTYDPSDTSNDVLQKSSQITVAPATVTVVFEQLSGRITPPVSMTMTDGIKSATIDINSEGGINW